MGVIGRTRRVENPHKNVTARYTAVKKLTKLQDRRDTFLERAKLRIISLVVVDVMPYAYS